MGKGTLTNTAGYGSKHLHRDGRDNVGKGRGPAGTRDNLHRPHHQGTTEAWGGAWSDARARRSCEGGVTPSEVTSESPWLVGNAHPRQRGSGHSVVLMTPHEPRHRAGSYSSGELGRGGSKTVPSW